MIYKEGKMKFLNKKEDVDSKLREINEVEFKKNFRRKFIDNSPDFLALKEEKYKRNESIERYESAQLKLPAIRISQKSPLMKSFNDFHSKSLSPLKLRQTRLFEKERPSENSKMFFPSIIIY